MHHVFKIGLDGKTAYTKLENPINILDVGTGTGIWAIEMGASHLTSNGLENMLTVS